jgi:hypothetical protein
MKSLFSKYNYHFLLILISIFWILTLDFLLQIHQQTFIFPDTYSYLIASENLYKNHTIDFIRPVLMALFHGIPFLFGFPIEALFSWSLVVNIFSWLAIIMLLFEILKTFLNPRKAFLFALVYVFIIGSAVINFHLLSESVFTLFLFLSLYFFCCYYCNGKFSFLSLGLSVLLLSVLIKPASSGILILVFLFFAKKLLQNIFNKWSILIGLSCVSVFFYMSLMKNHYGNYTISYIDSFTYYNYLGTRADDLRTHSKFVQCDNKRFDYFTSLSLPEQKKAAFKDIKYQIESNSLNLFKAYMISIYTNSFKGCQAIYEYKNVNQKGYFEGVKFFFRVVSLMQNALLTLIGIFTSVYVLFRFKKIDTFIFLVAFFILYLFLISGISSEQGDRFHLVFYPQIIVLVAYFFNNKIRNSKTVQQ